MCCKLLLIESTGSGLNEWCKHCDPGVGCKIYSKRPQECRDFDCAWLLMERVKPELRPDICHCMWEMINDHVMLAIQQEDYDIKKITYKQIKEFNKNGSSVVFTRLNKEPARIYTAKGHRAAQIWEEVVKKHRELKNDGTKLHD
ncbi:MAG: hypothetical protein GWO26_09655 [Phycisphaerae bacterium]|nr:hypothetical protein [Phycisphaerae bacterium]